MIGDSLPPKIKYQVITLGTIIGQAVTLLVAIWFLYPYITTDKIKDWEYIRFGVGLIMLTGFVRQFMGSFKQINTNKEAKIDDFKKYDIREVK